MFSETKAQSQSQLINHPVFKVNIKVSKQDISLKTVSDNLTGCMPSVAMRNVGQKAWITSRADKLNILVNTPDSVCFTTILNEIEALIVLHRINGNTWEFSGSIKNIGMSTLELARFHYLNGIIADTATKFLTISGSMISNSTKLNPFRPSIEESWSQSYVYWPRLPDPVHDEENWGISLDAGIFTKSWTLPGWIFGFTGPGTAFGEIGYKTMKKPSEFYAGVLLDNIQLEAGETRILEKCIVQFNDWQAGLKNWANACASEFKVKANIKPLVGYCSWYQSYNNVTNSNIERATREFAQWPVPPGGRTIQIDDGYQIMPGNWKPCERFKEHWYGIPAKIKNTGSIPGLWLAPSAIFETHPMVKEHPEWLQRLPDNSFAISFSNWGYCDNPSWKWGEEGKKTYFMEVDRPEAKAFMTNILKDAVKDGWQYFKLDFTYNVSTARSPYNVKKTRFETLSDMYKLFRQASGPDIILNACIGEPGRYALGNVNIARLAGDMGSNWASIKDNLTNVFLRLQTNGVWWQADPDVFYMRKEQSNLNDEESYLLTATIGLMGGMFLTSDYPSQWSPEATEAVKEFWNTQGNRVPHSQFMLFDDDGTPKAFRVSYNDNLQPGHKIAVYNWDDFPQSTVIELAELGLNKNINWKQINNHRNTSLKLVGNQIIVTNQPTHSLRIIGLQ